MRQTVAFHRFLFLPKFYDRGTNELVVREFEEIFRKALEWSYNLIGKQIKSDKLESMVLNVVSMAKSNDVSKLKVKYIGGTKELSGGEKGPLEGEINGKKVQVYVEARVFEDYWLLELACDIESNDERDIEILYESIKSFELPKYVEDFYLIQANGVEFDTIHRVLKWESLQTTEFGEFNIYWSEDEFDSFVIVHKLETPNFMKAKLDFVHFYLVIIRLNEIWDEYREIRNELMKEQDKLNKQLNFFSENGECNKAMTQDSGQMREKVEKLDDCLNRLLKAYQPARERLTRIDSSLHSLEVNFEALKLVVRRIHPHAENSSPFRELIMTYEAHVKQLRSDHSRHINLLSWAEHLFEVISTEVQIERQKLEQREEERERKFSRTIEIIAVVLSALGISGIFDYNAARAVYKLVKPDSGVINDLVILFMRILFASIFGLLVYFSLKVFTKKE